MRARRAVLWLCLAGCQFDPGGVGYDERADARPPPIADAAVDAPVTAVDGGEPPDAPPPPPPRYCDPGNADLVACYRFETSEHANQPFDESRYGNHGTARAAGYRVGHAGTGRAIVTGDDTDVRIPDSPSLDVSAALTIEFWLFPDQMPAAGSRAGLVDSDQQFGVFLAPGGEVRCLVAGHQIRALTVPLARWSHVACTYDGATVSLYQDGELGATLAGTGPINASGTADVTLGQNSPSGEHLQGAIDDLRIWRVARSAAQICAAGCTP